MTGNRVAKRYAKALYGLAEDKGQIEIVNMDLELIDSVLRNSEDLHMSLDNPVLSESRKLAICLDVFSANVSDIIKTFLNFLSEKNRLSILADICLEYFSIYKEKSGIVEAKVYSAVSLLDTQKEKITESLSRISGKKVLIQEESDKTLMGGIAVRLGDEVFDSTISSKLRRLSKTLKNE